MAIWCKMAQINVRFPRRWGLQNAHTDSIIVAPVTHSEVTKSALLVDQSSQYPIKDFIPAFQRFYEGLVMSFISEGYLEIAKTEDVSCLRTRLENRFRYLPRSLWIGACIFAYCKLAARS